MARDFVPHGLGMAGPITAIGVPRFDAAQALSLDAFFVSGGELCAGQMGFLRESTQAGPCWSCGNVFPHRSPLMHV
jgi:hypothetical protein